MTSRAELIFGTGCAEQVDDLVRAWGARKVLVVASTRRLAATGLFGGPPTPRTPDVTVFSGFTANPRLEDVLDGCRLRDDLAPDLVVGVGGGSAMDTAKLVRVLPARLTEALAVLRGTGPGPDCGPGGSPGLLLIPTTAGTGSEVTQFATVYADRVKMSLDDPLARPDLAVVDPALTVSCPPALTASCAFDALAHAMESLWSVRSTVESRWIAQEAGTGIVAVLRATNGTYDLAARERLSALAIQAGLAINVTRTTAGHAFGYPLTARYGVAHGLACLLSLSWLLPLAVEHRDEWCSDRRGRDFLSRRLGELARILEVGRPVELGVALRELIVAAGFAPELAAHGMRPEHVESLVDAALASNRSGNSPVGLDRAATGRALLAAL